MNLLKFCVMLAITAAFYPLAVQGQLRSGPARVLAAEADTVIVSAQGEKPLSHWKLWKLSDGSYQVDVKNAQQPSPMQEFRFNSQMIPLGYTLKSPGSGKAGVGMTLACRYKPTQLVCTTTSLNGKKSVTSIAAQQPFVVTPEFYGLDLSWFMTGVVHLATRDNAKDGVVNAYFVEDGNTPETIRLTPDEPTEIVPVLDPGAKENAKEQSLETFEVVGDKTIPILRLDGHGQVVSMTGKLDPHIGLFSTRNYKEYAGWGYRNKLLNRAHQ